MAEKRKSEGTTRRRKKTNSIEEKRNREISKLLEKLITKDHKHLMTRVAHILCEYPDTRDSDVTLLLKYWEIFEGYRQGDSIEPKHLYERERLTSLTRERAKIQNEYQLYQASADVRKHRREKEDYEKELQLTNKPQTAHIHVYADESGKNDKYTVIGSVWVHDEGLNNGMIPHYLNWKKENATAVGKIGEFHFTEMKKGQLNSYKEFFRESYGFSSMATYIGVAVNKEKVRDKGVSELIYAIYKQVLILGIDHLLKSGIITLPRQVTYYKDKDEGDDRLFLLELSQNLKNHLNTVYEKHLIFNDVQALEPRLHFGVQFADLFTGAISRSLNYPGNDNHKDEFSRFAIDLTGVKMVHISEEYLDKEEPIDFGDKAILFIID